VEKKPDLIYAEFTESDARRPQGTVNVPVSSIDGTPSVAWLCVKNGPSPSTLLLTIGERQIEVRADDLSMAISSLLFLRPFRPVVQEWVGDPCCPMPPPPPPRRI
jgi:hypothetical protein